VLLCWSAQKFLPVASRERGFTPNHSTSISCSYSSDEMASNTPRVPTRTFRRVVLGTTGVRRNESPTIHLPFHEQPLVERHWTYAAKKLRPMTLVLEGRLQIRKGNSLTIKHNINNFSRMTRANDSPNDTRSFFAFIPEKCLPDF